MGTQYRGTRRQQIFQTGVTRGCSRAALVDGDSRCRPGAGGHRSEGGDVGGSLEGRIRTGTVGHEDIAGGGGCDQSNRSRAVAHQNIVGGEGCSARAALRHRCCTACQLICGDRTIGNGRSIHSTSGELACCDRTICDLVFGNAVIFQMVLVDGIALNHVGCDDWEDGHLEHSGACSAVEAGNAGGGQAHGTHFKFVLGTGVVHIVLCQRGEAGGCAGIAHGEVRLLEVGGGCFLG